MDYSSIAAWPQGLPLLVVGDLMLDETLRGRVGRISPEAPVPVLEWEATQHALGGAGNVAANLAALGALPRVCGAVGDDPPGGQVRALLTAAGCEISGIVDAAGRPTTHKMRVLGQGQHLLRVDREVRTPLPAELQQACLAQVDSSLPHVRGIVCSDYAKGVLSPHVMQNIVQAAQQAGLPIIVDPKGRDYSAYRGATVLTPNMHELEMATGTSIGAWQDMDAAAWGLLERLELQGLLVTCGKDGMVLFGQDGRRVRIATEAREVFDVTGAGDTVVAAFAMAHLAGASLQEAARLANVAAGCVVGKQGTATVSRAELAAACAQRQGERLGKVIDVAAAQSALAARQALGERIVMTNGCFDLLHAGHVRYLQAAKAMGERLVVGLNTDRSVRELKGAGRPLVPQAARAEVLAALACVDYVVLFDTPTPAALVAALQPDILVKGAEYAGKEVVGRTTVENRGGRVVLLPMLPGHSTTDMVTSIVARHGPPQLG
jgi:D-beta-D-heptose 7-phosphate kinase/D-beta-D-heptose 1-phosphate adenosyltransferase